MPIKLLKSLTLYCLRLHRLSLIQLNQSPPLNSQPLVTPTIIGQQPTSIATTSINTGSRNYIFTAPS
ncbi:hypothetical protein L1887_28828 [Cichorium endivia]|nr:hypothetical protein L1887_28828 [Cichorium endivia]